MLSYLLCFWFEQSLHTAAAAAVNKKNDKVCFLQQEGSTGKLDVTKFYLMFDWFFSGTLDNMP